MPKKRRPTKDAVEILHRRYFEGKPERLAMLAEARLEDEIARKIYTLRTQAHLSQGELAKRVGTTATVINDLEEADYEGNSLAMLGRIASALGKQMQIRFVSAKKKAVAG